MIIESHSTKGAYNSFGYLAHKIKVTESNTIVSSRQLTEKIRDTIETKDTGGIIVLSTDVNAVKQDENKIIDFIKKKAATISNRLFYKKKIDRASKKYEDIYAWTIGKFLNGRYKADNGQIFDENSISVELLGVDTKTLIKFAEEICRTFKQESVLVKDYANNKIYFVDGDDSDDIE